MSIAGLVRRRSAVVGVGGVLIVLGLLAGPAWGATVPATCANLQTKINSANPGDTIQLTELCTTANSPSGHPSFTTPTVANVTIAGAAAGDGFDGTGAISPALSGAAPGLTLSNLTFENYDLTNNGAVVLSLSSGARLPVIDHDTFANNIVMSTGLPSGAGLDIADGNSTCPYTGSLTIDGSVFSGNHLSTTDSTTGTTSGITGGGASIAFQCASPHTVNLAITGNTFEQNSIHTAGAAANGGGLYVANGGSGDGQLTATQSGNLFESNSIVNTGSAATSFSGGGEWLGSVNLTSSSDAYIGNSLPGPGTGSSSEGAGLGVVRSDCPGFSRTVSATATNLVSAGNAIGTPSGSGSVEGAGVYAGCTAVQGSQGFQLTLEDSTVSGNSGPGGAAGVDGESADTLTLDNSIVAGNTGGGGTDLGGFGTPDGANVTASYSDVCAIGSTAAPFAGTGNVCADPKLAGAANGDVHETAASPTSDAGSNALGPGGVSTDFYGQPRIVGTKQAAGIVDIGAAEYQTAFTPPSTTPSPAPTTPTPVTTPPPAQAHVVKEKATASGVDVTIKCLGTSAQRCAGAIGVITIETRLGPKVIAVASAGTKHRHRTIVVAKRAYALAGGATITVHVRLNATGRRLLARFHRLPVQVTVTQVAHAKPISTRKLTIRARKLKHPSH